MKIVTTQMEVPFDNIELGFYDDEENKVSTGSPFGEGVFLGSGEDINMLPVFIGEGENMTNTKYG